jgi:hypothetical protein
MVSGLTVYSDLFDALCAFSSAGLLIISKNILVVGIILDGMTQ